LNDRGGFVNQAFDAVIVHAYVSGNVANNFAFAWLIAGGDTYISGYYYNSTENPSSTVVYDNESSGTVEIEGKTDEELKQIDTFDGWDISEEGSGEDTLWFIKEWEKYPYFNPDFVPYR